MDARGQRRSMESNPSELAQNLLYQLRLKALAIQAEVESIVGEHRELVIRAEVLEELDRLIFMGDSDGINDLRNKFKN